MIHAEFKLNMFFLKALCRFLKAFSLHLQRADTCINDYVITVECQKQVLRTIDISGNNVSPAVQYHFKDNLEDAEEILRAPNNMDIRNPTVAAQYWFQCRSVCAPRPAQYKR